MGIVVAMPRYGANMEEGTLASWAVGEGDAVSKGEVICEIEIEKLSNEVDAPEAGVIRAILCPEGETVPCGTPLAVIADADEDIGTLLEKLARDRGSEPARDRGSELARDRGSENSDGVHETDSADLLPSGQEKLHIRFLNREGERQPDSASKNSAFSEDEVEAVSGFPGEVPGIRITPKALKLAEELGFDYRPVKGSGIGGAIIRDDIRAYSAKHPDGGKMKRDSTLEVNLDFNSAGVPGTAVPEARTAPTNCSVPLRKAAPERARFAAAMSPARKTIARRMMESVSGSAQTTIMMDADLTAAAAEYTALKTAYEQTGVKLSYTAVILKSVAEALGSHPIIRTVIEHDTDLYTLTDIDIGVAVDADSGLLVPILRHIDRKELRAICSELTAAVDRARAGTTTPEEVRGGCFTVTNVGVLGVRYFTPILNPPQSAVLGIGVLRDEVRIIDGGMHIRKILGLSMTYDHRIIDGAPAARFLGSVCRILAQGIMERR